MPRLSRCFTFCTTFCKMPLRFLLGGGIVVSVLFFLCLRPLGFLTAFCKMPLLFLHDFLWNHPSLFVWLFVGCHGREVKIWLCFLQCFLWGMSGSLFVGANRRHKSHPSSTASVGVKLRICTTRAHSGLSGPQASAQSMNSTVSAPSCTYGGMGSPHSPSSHHHKKKCSIR